MAGNGRYTRAGKERAEKIREILEKHKNGVTQWQLVIELGLPPSRRLDSSLASLDRQGVMVSEDERGRLFLFEERGLYTLKDWDRW